MKNKLLIFNWQNLVTGKEEAKELLTICQKNARKNPKIIVLPPTIYLGMLSEKLLKDKKSYLKLGAQGVFIDQKKILRNNITTLEMLKKNKVDYVLFGEKDKDNYAPIFKEQGDYKNAVQRGLMTESEITNYRNQLSISNYELRNESEITNCELNKGNIIRGRIKDCLASSITPIISFGEQENNDNIGFFSELEREIVSKFKKLKKEEIKKVILAYCPKYYLNNVKIKREDILEIIIFIKRILSDLFGKESEKIIMLYGGSVDSKNIQVILEIVDGVIINKNSTDFWELKKILQLSLDK